MLRICRKVLLSASFVLLLLPSFSDASVTSFTYNGDIECGYPFEDFTIQEIECSDSSYTFVGDGNGYADVCSFGQYMDIQGEVTASETLYRYFGVKMNICYQKFSFYGYRHCEEYTSSIDLMSLADSQEEQDAGGSQDQNQQQSYEEYQQQQYEANYLEQGSYKFGTRLHIPSKSFTFREGTYCIAGEVCPTPISFSFATTQRPPLVFFFLLLPSIDYIVSATITFFPREKYKYAIYAYDSYDYKTMCTASFSAVADANASYMSYGYAAAAVVAVMGALGAVFGTRRRICTCVEAADGLEEDGDGIVDDEHVVSSDFEKMGDRSTQEDGSTAVGKRSFFSWTRKSLQ